MHCLIMFQALINSCKQPESLNNDTNIRMICLYDNEEVGSQSAQGAGSSITEYIMRRISKSVSTMFVLYQWLSNMIYYPGTISRVTNIPNPFIHPRYIWHKVKV